MKIRFRNQVKHKSVSVDYSWHFFQFFLIFLKNAKLVDSWVELMLRSSVAWLYLGFIGGVCFALLIAFKIAPKIPLIISVPIAVVAWPVFLWFAWTHVT
jgi:hypothetical protein